MLYEVFINMKKLLTALLSLLLVFALCACSAFGGDAAADGGSEQSSGENTPAPTVIVVSEADTDWYSLAVCTDSASEGSSFADGSPIGKGDRFEFSVTVGDSFELYIYDKDGSVVYSGIIETTASPMIITLVPGDGDEGQEDIIVEY